MSILIYLVISYILLSITLYFVFEKAGVAGWKGLVPGLNFTEWCKLIGRSPWHAAFLLFPIVNIFIFCGMAVDMVRSFRKYKLIHSAIAVVYAPAIFAQLGFGKDEQYDGPTLVKEAEYKAKIAAASEKKGSRELKKLLANNPYKKSSGREWFEAIIFAVFAAAFIRMFLIEAYKIPTPSMEGSLLVGDFLFVSKAHYGMRMPMTPIMIPLLHNRVPILGGESYWEKPSLKYRRLPALESIDRNEPIVFNWPVGDSVYLTPQRSWTYGQAQRQPEVAQQVRGAKLITRPIDKKDHYIKRCIGLPGDSLEIRERQVYINGKEAENPRHLQYVYMVDAPQGRINRDKLEEIGADQVGRNYYTLTEDEAEKIKGFGNMLVQLIPQNGPNLNVFPNHPTYYNNWTIDNFGPVYIPQAGATVDLNLKTLTLYRRIIDVYEENDLKVEGGKIFINGKRADSYTFKQDYYWAMGDNRHNSEDSRFWGYVPHDHIVGKPLFIWFSTKKGSILKGINWKRIFSGANKM